MPRLAPLLAHVRPQVKALIVQRATDRGVSQGTIVRDILEDWWRANAAALGTTPRAVRPADPPPDEAPTFIRPAAPPAPVTRNAMQPEEARR